LLAIAVSILAGLEEGVAANRTPCFQAAAAVVVAVAGTSTSCELPASCCG
jgi:hypothetical protein